VGEMGLLADLTIQGLRAATLAQLKTAVTNKINLMTKKQIIILILKVASVDIENFEIEENKIVYDALGNKIRSWSVDYIYYPTGEIDLIVLKKFDALGVLIEEKKIKHYLDGKQPHIMV
jgi:hypothetical protein